MLGTARSAEGQVPQSSSFPLLGVEKSAVKYWETTTPATNMMATKDIMAVNWREVMERKQRSGKARAPATPSWKKDEVHHAWTPPEARRRMGDATFLTMMNAAVQAKKQ